MSYRRGLGASPTITSITHSPGDGPGAWHVWGTFDPQSQVLLNGTPAAVWDTQRGPNRLDLTDPSPGTGGTFQVVEPSGARSNVVSAGKVDSLSAVGNVALSALPGAFSNVGNLLTAAPAYLQSTSLSSMVGLSYPNWWLLGGAVALLFLFGKRGG